MYWSVCVVLSYAVVFIVGQKQSQESPTNCSRYRETQLTLCLCRRDWVDSVLLGAWRWCGYRILSHLIYLIQVIQYLFSINNILYPAKHVVRTELIVYSSRYINNNSGLPSEWNFNSHRISHRIPTWEFTYTTLCSCPSCMLSTGVDFNSNFTCGISHENRMRRQKIGNPQGENSHSLLMCIPIIIPTSALLQ